ncbi:MAG: hypothetical protein ABSD47_08880 [Candidatus Methylomirabilota bacterium]|jgi:hypothetical protein
MRKLIYVPIVHTTADMGSQAEALEREHVRRHGRGEWARTRRLIDEVWEGLRTRLLALALDYRGVRIYQDGLPVCGRELDIVREVAQAGSRNYTLILELLKRGAVVEGTESPDLLREEYERIRSAIPKKSVPRGRMQTGELASAGLPDQAREESARESERILRQRDEFIGRRIDETLKGGEVGILFIGLMHWVDRFLPGDVEVQYLIHRLPFHIPPGEPGQRRGHDA